MQVRAKKSLGQHFLTDANAAQRIVDSLEGGSPDSPVSVLEIGPGMGVLTGRLLERDDISLKMIELDSESVVYLREHYPVLGPGLLEADFLKLPLDKIFAEPFSVIGNFPYNISSQIFFHILDYRDLVPEVVCMIQKEVAERLAAGPGSKVYGILSVLLQMWYDIEYRFTVGEGAFVPPPKVKSAVIRLTRNARTDAGCDKALLRRIVKATFNQRRKTIRNGLRSIGITAAGLPFLDARPEQLSVEDFITLTRAVTEARREG